ncbi:ABC transporter ATP-binding protein, partial [Frankia sp. AgKG'84/4]
MTELDGGGHEERPGSGIPARGTPNPAAHPPAPGGPGFDPSDATASSNDATASSNPEGTAWSGTGPGTASSELRGRHVLYDGWTPPSDDPLFGGPRSYAFSFDHLRSVAPGPDPAPATGQHPAAAPPAVTAIDVRVRRGARRRGRGGLEIIHGVSFVVPRGSVTGVIGPSGGGKTTLLRAIVGVQNGVEGDLRVHGYAAGDACLRRRVGYATQAASVYADLTVRENLRYFAALVQPADRHGAGAWTAERLDALLAHVGLSDQATILVDQLSGGQRSRVSLAAAMISGTDLLVLDEPTVGADPLLRRRLWRDFRRMAAEGTTILVSSHVMDEANRCDRLLLLYEGRLLAQGTPAQLLATTDCGDLEEGFLRLVEHPRRLADSGIDLGRRRGAGAEHEPPPMPVAPPRADLAVAAAGPAERPASWR